MTAQFGPDGKTGFLATLSRKDASNWPICKEAQLWGSGSSSHAKYAARTIQAGDVIFVWQSGSGLFAAAEAVGPATPVGPSTRVPWPNPERYLATVPIRLITELDDPLPDTFPGYVGERFGVQTYQLQSGFAGLDPVVAESLASALHLDLDDSGDERHLADDDEVGTIVERPDPSDERPFMGVHLAPTSSVLEAMLALYRKGVTDQAGELLVVGLEEQRAAFDHEVGQMPFVDLRARFRFVTRQELAADLVSGAPIELGESKEG